jgi:hypothetical protein
LPSLTFETHFDFNLISKLKLMNYSVCLALLERLQLIAERQMSTSDRSDEHRPRLPEQLDDHQSDTNRSIHFRLANASESDSCASNRIDSLTCDTSNDERLIVARDTLQQSSGKMVDQVDSGDRGSSSPAAIRSDGCCSSDSNVNDSNNNSLKAIDQHVVGTSLESSRNISPQQQHHHQQTQQHQQKTDFDSLSQDTKSAARSLLNGCLNDSGITLVDSNNNEFTGKHLLCSAN